MTIQSDQFNGFPIYLGNHLYAGEKPTAMPFFGFNFSTATPTADVSYDINLENQMQRNLIRQVQSVYFDNVAGGSEVTVNFIRNTWQKIVVPPGFQGYIPLIISGDCRFTITGKFGGSASFQMVLLNIPVNENWWPRQVPWVVANNGRVAQSPTALYPYWRSNSTISGQVTANGNTTIRAAAPGVTFFITSIMLGITGSAQLAAPGDLIIRVQSNTTEIMRAMHSIGAAVPGSYRLLDQSDIGVNGIALGDSLSINLSAALTAGAVFYTIGYGFTQMAG